MPAYLKIEELHHDSNHDVKNNMLDSLMDLSLLALLITPLAILALSLHALDTPIITPGMFIAANAVLMIALPQLARLLKSKIKTYK